ncbi:hypothetical protein D3OALGB2SA_1801 [Olavius algarvensis associated proteobacterium Delta 3]|nr:hypothetical protein D3OALGB2SA_1801 [Olavius algarvensis associated proteobacterium Delta 3]
MDWPVWRFAGLAQNKCLKCKMPKMPKIGVIGLAGWPVGPFAGLTKL